MDESGKEIKHKCLGHDSPIIESSLQSRLNTVPARFHMFPQSIILKKGLDPGEFALFFWTQSPRIL